MPDGGVDAVWSVFGSLGRLWTSMIFFHTPPQENGNIHNARGSDPDPSGDERVPSPIAVCLLRYAQGSERRVAPVILGQGVKHEFDPGGDPQFLENLEQIILDRML